MLWLLWWGVNVAVEGGNGICYGADVLLEAKLVFILFSCVLCVLRRSCSRWERCSIRASLQKICTLKYPVQTPRGAWLSAQATLEIAAKCGFGFTSFYRQPIGYLHELIRQERGKKKKPNPHTDLGSTGYFGWKCLVFHATAAACQVCADRTLKHASVICLHFFASPCCFQHAKNHQNSEILSRGCRKRNENVFPVSNHLLILPVLKNRIYWSNLSWLNVI